MSYIVPNSAVPYANSVVIGRIVDLMFAAEHEALYYDFQAIKNTNNGLLHKITKLVVHNPFYDNRFNFFMSGENLYGDFKEEFASQPRQPKLYSEKDTNYGQKEPDTFFPVNYSRKTPIKIYWKFSKEFDNLNQEVRSNSDLVKIAASIYAGLKASQNKTEEQRCLVGLRHYIEFVKIVRDCDEVFDPTKEYLPTTSHTFTDTITNLDLSKQNSITIGKIVKKGKNVLAEVTTTHDIPTYVVNKSSGTGKKWGVLHHKIPANTYSGTDAFDKAVASGDIILLDLFTYVPEPGSGDDEEAIANNINEFITTFNLKKKLFRTKVRDGLTLSGFMAGGRDEIDNSIFFMDYKYDEFINQYKAGIYHNDKTWDRPKRVEYMVSEDGEWGNNNDDIVCMAIHPDAIKIMTTFSYTGVDRFHEKLFSNNVYFKSYMEDFSPYRFIHIFFKKTSTGRSKNDITDQTQISESLIK